MGIHLATAMSLRTRIPFAVIRKKNYGLPGEISLDQETGYSKSPMFINGVKRGDRVMIMDDTVSTGGTLRAIVNALKANGITVTEAAVVYNKCDDLPALEKEIGIPINWIIRVGVRDNKPVVLV